MFTHITAYIYVNKIPVKIIVYKNPWLIVIYMCMNFNVLVTVENLISHLENKYTSRIAADTI